MWSSHLKDDLIIEVWEKLDCETVGRTEIESIIEAVGSHFGEPAVDTPMTIARKLADEGAELRHSELMELHLEHLANIQYEAEFRNLLKLTDLRTARKTLRDLENLRKRFSRDADKKGLRFVKEAGKKARDLLSKDNNLVSKEIDEWFRLWLQSPELFESWIELRVASTEYKNLFDKKAS